MATIITINSADLMETLTRTNLNTNFANLNAELATMLPKSGGTMSGNIAMGSNRITGLPAPSANDEPARKQDFDNAVLLTGNQTITGTKTFSTTPVVPDASFGRLKLAAGRRVLMLFGVCKTGTTYLRLSDVALVHSLRMRRAGCLVGLTLYGAATTGQVGQAYVSSGTAAAGRFGDGDRIEFTRNTSTGFCSARINGTNVTTLQLDAAIGSTQTDDLYVVIEFELDD